MGARKPPTAAFYSPVDLERVRGACLTLATYLGSFLDDLVVVGGLTPSLLIDAERAREPHAGTQDLDLGLSLAILEEHRYVALIHHLRSAAFEPDVTAAGTRANHRWRHREEHVTVDFLIPSRSSADARVRVIAEDLSAVVASALPLAFRDRRKIQLTGRTLRGETATRALWVCGPGAFVVLKALAFRGRGENKDAYDLLYVLENFGAEYLIEVADALRPLMDDPTVGEALAVLRADFTRPSQAGPKRAAEFLSRSGDGRVLADHVGAVQELLRMLDR